MPHESRGYERRLSLGDLVSGAQVPVKRKATPDKMRFEVFKRDKFTCQYCGAKAPEAILRADHIIPVCEGGTTTLINLATSCLECNSGKGGKLLSDESAAVRSRQAAEDSEERRQQIEMIAEWHLSLSGGDHEVGAICRSFTKLTDKYVSDHGKKKVRSYLRRYGFDRVMKCLIIACRQVRAGSRSRKAQGHLLLQPPGGDRPCGVGAGEGFLQAQVSLGRHQRLLGNQGPDASAA